MSETQTPRTDAEVLWIPNGPDDVRTVDIDFARTLERELSAALARAEALEATVARCKQVCAATAEGWKETQAELDAALAKVARYETLRPIAEYDNKPQPPGTVLFWDKEEHGVWAGWADRRDWHTHWTPLPDVKEAK